MRESNDVSWNKPESGTRGVGARHRAAPDNGAGSWTMGGAAPALYAPGEFATINQSMELSAL
jgi:hypothetical protein